MELRFYLDENIPIEVTRQLQLSGIEGVSAHSLDKLSDPDESHLQRALAMNHLLWGSRLQGGPATTQS